MRERKAPLPRLPSEDAPQFSQFLASGTVAQATLKLEGTTWKSQRDDAVAFPDMIRELELLPIRQVSLDAKDDRVAHEPNFHCRFDPVIVVAAERPLAESYQGIHGCIFPSNTANLSDASRCESIMVTIEDV